MELRDLDVYRSSREISHEAWKIYSRFTWEERKIIGNQWIEAVDSVGANIAEGFGRFHYLDRNKFNYNARGSLIESVHWTELLHERGKMSDAEFNFLRQKFEQLLYQLNTFIQKTRERSQQSKRVS